MDTLVKSTGGNGHAAVASVKGNGSAMTKRAATGLSQAAADIKAHYEAKLQAAYDQARSAPKLENVDVEGWWDLIAIGPLQPIGDPPYLSNDVIRAGEPAYVVTIMLLNPFGPAVPSASDLLSNFGLPYEITYNTGNLTQWKPGPASLNVEHKDKLVPGLCFYVDVLEFNGEGLDEVMYEMNISARIFGCGGIYAPPFAGFAREVVDVDPSFWSPPPGIVDAPIRFLVYGDHDPNEVEQ